MREGGGRGEEGGGEEGGEEEGGSYILEYNCKVPPTCIYQITHCEVSKSCRVPRVGYPIKAPRIHNSCFTIVSR